jgi:hypothetical protein
MHGLSKFFKHLAASVRTLKDDVVDLLDTITDWVIPAPIRELLTLLATKVSQSNADAVNNQKTFAADPVAYNAMVSGGQAGAANMSYAGGAVTINVNGAGDPQAVGNSVIQALQDYDETSRQNAAAQLGFSPSRNN